MATCPVCGEGFECVRCARLSDRLRQYDERVDMLRIALIGACGILATAVDMGVPNASTMREVLRALYLDTGGPIE